MQHRHLSRLTSTTQVNVNNVVAVNSHMKFKLVLALVLCLPGPLRAEPAPIEIHETLALPSAQERVIALTLDACGGGYDEALLRFLVERRIPATIFATRKWLQRQPAAVSFLRAHADLFDIEDHGDRHIPAVIGTDRLVWGIRASRDQAQVQREVEGGAKAVTRASGRAPRWYRGATGEYDIAALSVIQSTGLHVAGFSINADDGGKLSKRQILRRLERVKSGDIIIAHMNRPESDTAAGLAEGLRRLQARGFRFITLRDVDVRLTPESARHLVRSARASRG